MTDYAQMAHEFSLRHRPVALAQIQDPHRFFAEAGREVQATVTATRDELLGPVRPGETPEAYRLRSYQALRTAEEVTLADHYLFQPEDDLTSDGDDDVMEADRRMQALVAEALATPTQA